MMDCSRIGIVLAHVTGYMYMHTRLQRQIHAMHCL